MEAINDLLEDAQLLSLRDAGLTIVSIFGNSGFRSTSANANGKLTNLNVTIANRIVGTEVFVPNGQAPLDNTVELSKGLQLYVDPSSKTAYIFMDASIDTASLADIFRNQNQNDTVKNSMQSLLSKQQSTTMRGLLLMFLVSHLVIPILPPRLLPADFMSELVNLAQVKNGIYTHLAQLQSACWKFWEISVPSALFERREIENRRDRDRLNSNLMGWWGPAKGVPMMIFIAAEVTIPNVDKVTRSTLPVAMKRMQEVIQARIKNIFRAFNFVPSADNGISRDPIEVRSLFTLPTTSQPFVHIIPANPFATTSTFSDEVKSASTYANSFDKLTSISAWLKENGDDDEDDYIAVSAKSNQIDVVSATARRKDTPKQPIESVFDDCGNKLLRNFVNHWTRAATTRHPMHLQIASSSGPRKGNNDSKHHASSSPLPTGLQFASALVLLKKLLFFSRDDGEENEHDFRKDVIAQSPGAKGMIQQIEVVLRKKIRDTIEIERVFSRSHSLDIMRKCIEAYLQESPPCYTKHYHLWKRDSVLRLYSSLARGPCAAEFGARLERECDLIWKQGRQSCERVSLTGKVCRLKAGHEDMDPENEKHARDMDSSKHSSGCSFFHACDCGKTQKLREDPFDLEEANIKFYQRFTCCLSNGHAALNLQDSTFGEAQDLVKDERHIPHFDAALLYLGAASTYRNSIGLDKYEGFMNNTNYLLPWTMARTADLAPKEPSTATEAIQTPADLRSKKRNPASNDTNHYSGSGDESNRKGFNTNEWPLPGKKPEVAITESRTKAVVPPVANLDAFPVLGSSRTSTEPSPAIAQAPPQQEVKVADNPPPPPKKEKRRRDAKRKDREHRLDGLIRGYVGAEYECPLGHRFLSCGDGRICKLGHKGHPKEHANYFVHQDLPLYVLCPCNYANANPKTAATGDVTAQLQRCYAVTPDASITISFKPRVKIVSASGETMEFNMGVDKAIILPKDSVHVFRLPYIYRDLSGNPIPVEPNISRRLKSAMLMKDCFQVHPLPGGSNND
ncbi:hypothetical protein BDB00DRAFT_863586 [Zychaea mexicana]|uniref:uncharacterized protein n=1 Tax=Zychaea mexicana TaxID=64656 RepID=UPI0022FF331F|nr:uncharacterized protein BDB00DRAFT_863586 [Zychaea mexicana]KAI9468670.1 hypothetical protein BDB00DRAFT_863586 [Zychaea mexicana]